MHTVTIQCAHQYKSTLASPHQVRKISVRWTKKTSLKSQRKFSSPQGQQNKHTHIYDHKRVQKKQKQNALSESSSQRQTPSWHSSSSSTEEWKELSTERKLPEKYKPAKIYYFLRSIDLFLVFVAPLKQTHRLQTNTRILKHVHT